MADTDRSLLNDALDWMYRRVAGDLSGHAAPIGEHEIDRQIAIACTQAGAAGFVTNMGGLLTLPLAIPANLAGTAAVQMRLIAKIAAARGYDTHSDEVKTFVFVCLLGNAGLDLLKEAGLRVGQRLGGAALQRLNQTVLSRLLARFGAQGAVSVTKVVPLVGGLVGGGLDAASTRLVGRMAKRVFVQKPEPAAAPDPAVPLLPAPSIA